MHRDRLGWAGSDRAVGGAPTETPYGPRAPARESRRGLRPVRAGPSPRPRFTMGTWAPRVTNLDSSHYKQAYIQLQRPTDMRKLTLIAACILAFFPALALGGLDVDDLPGTTTWYFHADFVAMRSTEGGKGLWVWLDKEVFDDIHDEVGIDLGTEADRITAYSTNESGVVIVLEGELTQETKDKALAAAASAQKFETLKHKGKTYYYVQGDDDHDHDSDSDSDSDDNSIGDIDKQIYFSFAVKNRVIAATNHDEMLELIDSEGKIAASKSHNGALFVLTAESSLIQAGMDTEDFGEDTGDGGFKSNLLRNTKQVALMIADVAGKIAIEAQLIAKEPEMAQSLASIVRGLIALSAFSDDMEPEIAEFLRSTKVDVLDNLLKVSVTLSPEIVVSALEEA